jgi:hypothetical protein
MGMQFLFLFKFWLLKRLFVPDAHAERVRYRTQPFRSGHTLIAFTIELPGHIVPLRTAIGGPGGNSRCPSMVTWRSWWDPGKGKANATTMTIIQPRNDVP